MKIWEKLVGLIWLIVGAGFLQLGSIERIDQLDLWESALGVLAVTVAIPFLVGASEMEKKVSVRVFITAMMVLAQLGIWKGDLFLTAKVVLSIGSALVLYKVWRLQHREQPEDNAYQRG
jgi:hypothetical protein